MERIVFSLFILMLFFYSGDSNAQQLEKHQWQNRLILLFAEDPNNEMLKKQLKELETSEDGLAERKLIVYQIFSNEYRKGLKAKTQTNSSDLYFKYNSGNSPFKIILIGLDGGIKINKNDFITCKSLFNTIDQMPMRRNELRKKNGLN